MELKELNCVNIWKTSMAAYLVFPWIFVLNSVKHKFFHMWVSLNYFSRRYARIWTDVKLKMKADNSFQFQIYFHLCDVLNICQVVQSHVLNTIVTWIFLCQQMLIFNELSKFFEGKNLFSKHQSGSRPGESRIYQLLSVTHDIFSSFDCNSNSRVSRCVPWDI